MVFAFNSIPTLALLPAFFLAAVFVYDSLPVIADNASRHCNAMTIESEAVNVAEALHKRGDAAVQPVPNSLAQTKSMLAPMNNPHDSSR
jgi:hypothetical protein